MAGEAQEEMAGKGDPLLANLDSTSSTSTFSIMQPSYYLSVRNHHDACDAQDLVHFDGRGIERGTVVLTRPDLT